MLNSAITVSQTIHEKIVRIEMYLRINCIINLKKKKLFSSFYYNEGNAWTLLLKLFSWLI